MTEVKKIGTLENAILARTNNRRALIDSSHKASVMRSLADDYDGDDGGGLIRNNIGDNSFTHSRGRYRLSIGLSTM